MIVIWLKRFFVFVRWLVVKPTPRDVARVDSNAPCPVCGGRRGTIRAVEEIDGKLLCRHTCGVCGARWHEAAVVAVDIRTVWPSFPRTEVEARERMESLEMGKRARENDELQRRVQKEMGERRENARPWKKVGADR